MAKPVLQETHFRTDSYRIFLWTLTDTDPNGDWVELVVGRDRAFQMIVDSGSGTVTFQGTLESAAAPGSPRTLVGFNESGTLVPLVFSSATLAQVLTYSTKFRPVLGGAAGGTSVRVLLATGG